MGTNLKYMVRFRTELLRDIVALGHEVIATTPDPPDGSEGALVRIGVRYEPLTFHPTGVNPARAGRDLVRMRTWLARVEPDVFFGYGAKPASIGVLAAAAAGVRFRYAMLTGLGYAFVDDGTPSLKRWTVRSAQTLLYAAAFRSARRVIVQNPDDCRELVARGVVGRSRTVVVSGSGVDTAWFSPSPAPVDPMRFVYVGRLLRSKGVHELVEAAGVLRAASPRAEVHLVGAFDANPDQADAALLRDAEQRGDVVLHGHVDDVRSVLTSSSVFVLPSYREGVPRSALEAMAVGRTLIVADVPGSRDLVQPGRYGALVPPREVRALADAMLEYAMDPERVIREGRAVRAVIEREYAVERISRIMVEHLELVG